MGRIVKASLGTYVITDEPLFSGGGGELFEIDEDPTLLYKLFKEPLGGRHPARITELVEVGRRVAERTNLRRARRIAWPVDLEVDLGKVVGVIIPRAGREYFRPSVDKPLPQNFGHLAGAAVGFPSLEARLIILRQLAGVLAVLDNQGLVHGDVSGSNMLWTLDPTPSLLLVDCDGIRTQDFQVERTGTPYWADPRVEMELIRCADRYSDWYALALAVYRATILSFRETPRSHDFEWIAAELPVPIADKVIRVFSDSQNANARVPPQEWATTLKDVVKDETYCRQIDSLNQRRPATVAARRHANEHPRRPRPREPRQPRLPSRAQQSPRPSRNTYRAGRIRPASAARQSAVGKARRGLVIALLHGIGGTAVGRGARLLIAVGIVGLATLILYHFTGYPEWLILNTLNPFLSPTQRALVEVLPPGVHHCNAASPPLPASAVAAVRCEWSGHDIVAFLFPQSSAMDAFYRRRVAVAQAAMSHQHIPRQCPTVGRWPSRSVGAERGQLTFFASARGARIDWSNESSLVYFVGLGAPTNLKGLCIWWTHLDYE